MDEINVFQALLLAIIQGITEFLPVSSSGNLILFQNFFGVTGEQLNFTILVHVASALAILLFFFDRLWRLTRQLWLPVLVGTLPAVLVALFFKDAVETLFSNPYLVSLALFFTGFINLGIQYFLRHEKLSQLSSVKVWQGLIIGVAQAVAITPGVSRSGSTVFAGLLTGLSRKMAFEFSFLLAMPAIAGATVLQILSETSQSAVVFNEFFSLPYVVGFLGSFIASYSSLWLLKLMMEKAQFWWFSVYCFGIGALGLLIFL
jgi:undecaprenyl-diphosphatase